MNIKMILAGYGGQGALLAGQLLSYAAMNEDKHVTWFPSYGPEMRGGAASCTVIISDKRIGSPIIQAADAVLALNQPSFDKFEKMVKPGGFIIYNSSMTDSGLKESRDDIRYIGLPLSDMASDLGNLRVANMIALGAINAIAKCAENESIINALKLRLKNAELIELNKVAIEAGKNAVK